MKEQPIDCRTFAWSVLDPVYPVTTHQPCGSERLGQGTCGKLAACTCLWASGEVRMGIVETYLCLEMSLPSSACVSLVCHS